MLFLEISKIFGMVLIGYLMKNDLKSLLYFLLVLILFNTIFNFIRKSFCDSSDQISQQKRLESPLPSDE